MNVTNSSGQPCASAASGLISYPCPSGALTVSPAPTEVNPPTGTTPGQYTLNSQGYAEDQPIQQALGQYNFAASYAGDNSYTSSKSPTVPITITTAPTSVTLTGLPTTPVAGSPPAVTAVLVTQSNAVAPTGTMQLLNNGAPIGNPVTVYGTAATPGSYATAQASFYPSGSAGNYNFSARYSGDGNYASSTSAVTVVKVFDFSLAENPTSLTISTPGQSAKSTITITPVNGFAEPTNLTCSPDLDSGIGCTISPTTLNVTGSSAMTATLTITTTGTSSSQVPSFQRPHPLAIPQPATWPWLLAGFLAWAALICLMRPRPRPAVWLLVSGLLVVGAWIACGGSGSTGPTGPAPAPIISLSTTSLNFGQVAMGKSSAVQTVTLTNAGNATLDVGIDSIGGVNGTNFNLAQDPCSTAVIAPGGTCVEQLGFTPQTIGQATAYLTFTGNAGTYGTVNLSGTGVMPPTPPGTYGIEVSAVTASDDLVHVGSVAVTVQ